MKMHHLATAVLGTLLPAASTLAQPVDNAPAQSHWISVVLAILLIGCVGVASFRTSKRGHLD